MPTAPDINEIQSLLASSKEVFILTHENPNHDTLGASLALFLSLLQAGKKTTVACPTPATVEFNNLVGLDKLNQTLPGKNFIISLDYVDGSIEKVSYNIDGDKFNLVIEPKSGAPSFSSEKVHFSSAAASPDLILVLDCSNLGELGKFYQNEENLYSKTTIINIDYHPKNAYFGKINLVDPQASSTSEIVTYLISNLGLPMTSDVASNLLSGLTFATKNFSAENLGAGAFEAAALCLKAGGKRKRGEQPIAQEAVQEAPADWLTPKIFKSSSPSQTPKGESTTL